MWLLFALSLAGLQQSCGAPVISITYFRATTGDVESLRESIRKNVFSMDQRAVQAGAMKGAHLLTRGTTPGDWDVAIVDEYSDRCQLERVSEAFREISASHVPVLVNGKRLQELGRVVRSQRFSALPER